ncbi:MAG: SPASM domain-containing protein, partial [Planctomycetes bacterium]|nr:SPASM domain-containing protein [Planctomycetota bacterium]
SFSIDGIGEVYKSVRGWDYDDVENKITGFIEINKEMGHPVLTEMNMVEFESTFGQWIKIQNAWGNKVDILMKSPLMQRKVKRKRRCLNLWKSMVVLYNGTVVPCCLDMEAQMKLGNVNEENLLEIFNGDAIKELRSKHAKGEFPELCANCDEFFG